jgi:signal transduction histidine kinase
LDAISAGILILDEKGTVQYANRPASGILGQPVEALVGAQVESVLAPLARFAQRDSGTGRVEFDVTLKGGAQRSMGAHLSTYVDECTKTERHVCMFQDITAYADLRRERDRLLQYAALNQVLPGVLHELRNPLASAMAMLQVLVEETDGSLQQDLYALLGELRRMSLTLQGVGVVGHQLRSEGYYAVDSAIEETVRVMHGAAERARVTLTAQVATMPLLRLAAPVIKAITFNLVDNAISACSAGGHVTVTARLAGEADAKGAGRAFELIVEDDGRGMTSEVKQRCTELFFSTKPRGSGIGLTLCERAVKGAGGTLEVESTEGRGTRITVRVPLGR